MKNRSFAALLLVSSFGVSACRQAPPVAAVQQEQQLEEPAYFLDLQSRHPFDDSEVELPFSRISLWHTGCYGVCPIYRVDFFSDGRVVYEGEEFVEHVGQFAQNVGPYDVALLSAAIETMGLLEMQDRYAVSHTDDNTCIVEIEGAFGVKHIEDYGRQGPARLLAFQALVEQKVAELW